MGSGLRRLRNQLTQTNGGYRLTAAVMAMIALLMPLTAAAVGSMNSGTYTGDGAASHAIAGLGFQPDLVIVKAVTAEHSYARTKDMPAGMAKELASSQALQADLISSLDADGFTVGGNAAINAAGIEYHWVAMRAVSGSVAIGEYVGNGSVNHEITVPNMTPDVALVMSMGADEPVIRHTAMTDWRAYALDGSGKVNNSIGYFVPDGMVVSNSPATNTTGLTYYYVAWQIEIGSVASGTYVGNDQPGRDITGLNLNPSYLLIASDATVPQVQRPASLTGDTSLFFHQQAAQNNLIQAMWDDGFQVGTDASVNSGGTNYFWLALTDPGLTTDLEVAVSTGNQAPNEGDMVSFLVSVANPEAHDAAGVQVTDLLPAGLTFVSAVPIIGTTYDEVSGLWDIGAISAGSFRVLTLTATVDAGTAGTTLTNAAVLTATDLLDPNDTNNAAAVEITVLGAAGSDLAVSMAVDNDLPDEGQQITYVVSIVNNGPDNATGVQITDVLPGTLSVLTSTPDQGTYNQGNGTWDIGTINVGDVHTLTIDASVHSSTSGDTISNTALVTAVDQIDPNNTNDSATIDIMVASADLQVSKFVDATAPAEGDTVTYTIVATNMGPSGANLVHIQDLLPAGLTFQTATPSYGIYDDAIGDWNIDLMAVSEVHDLVITATVDAGTNGSAITNTASVSNLSQTDGDTTNNASSVEIVVQNPGAVDLQLIKTITEAAPNVGDTVTYTVTVINAGIGGATGINVTDTLPAEVTFVSAMTNKGSYDQGTGLWTIGDLAEGFQAVLDIQGTVNTAAIGATVTNTAAITASDQTDPNADNNSASVDFNVPVSDLWLTHVVDNSTPAVGDTVTFDLAVTNDGPNPATGIAVTNLLPTGLAFVGANTGTGTYDDVSGVWSVGGLNPSLGTFVAIRALVLPAAAGADIFSTASIGTADQADPDTTNNTATATIEVAGTDLALTLLSDVLVSLEGSDVNLTLTVANKGPQAATGIVISQQIPAGLTFQAATASQGTFDEGTGIWAVGDLAMPGSATLEIRVNVDNGTAGSVIGNLALITAAAPNDPTPANDSAVVSLTIWDGVPLDQSILWPLVGSSATVLPGGTQQTDVLNFAFTNRGTRPDTLHSLTLTNMTLGTGTTAQLDAEWQSLQAYPLLDISGNLGLLPVPVTASFSNDEAFFANLEWAVLPGDTLRVTIVGNASLNARDSAQLQAGIATGAHLDFNDPYTLVGTWPIVSGPILEVDGFVAAQATIAPLKSELLAIGSERNLALTVDLPGNGYRDDALYSLSLKNSGSAEPGADITRIEVWVDDEIAGFDAVTDTLLGTATYSGERWQLTGLNVSVPAAGRRFFITVDIAETGRPTRDIRLGLPVGNGYAVEMYSGNDGPVDVALESPSTLGISATDRIILTSEVLPAGVIAPGTSDTQLMQFILTNTYFDERRLESLTFTNTTEAAGASIAERDAICQQVVLWLDSGLPDGLLDVVTDLLLGSGSFQDDRVTFSGLTVDLAGNNSATRLFVTADVGLMTVADGNRIKGQIESIADISIQNANVVATWPLHSNSDLLVNGLIAEQVVTRDITVLTLGPGEGPVLAMDLIIPANGYAVDELSGITFVNDGTVTAADIQAATLWVDGGNGAFDGGVSGTGPDDISLGPLSLNQNIWTSNVLTEIVPAGGLHVFASLTVAAAPQDSVTVKLGLPVNGIRVSSGNDGPLDQAVLGNGSLVISTSPLRSTVIFTSAETDTGQTGTLVMTVRNAGSETVTEVAPSPLGFVAGDDLLVVGTHTPTIIAALAPGSEAVFTWPFVSALPGEVVLEGNVEGLVNGNQVRRSIVTPTSSHRIYTPVERLELYPTANLPFSINRGQQGLVPLTLTLANPGDADVANAELKFLRLRFMEAEDGPDIMPFDLVDRIIVSEGTNVFFNSDTDAMTAFGADIMLAFSDSVVITGSEPVTLGLRLDLSLNSQVPSFLVSIEEAGWLIGNDAVNGADLTIVHGDGTFPVRTGQATLVAPATGLNVAVVPQDPVAAVRGQTEVLLAEISLSQSEVSDSSSSIDVGQMAFVFHDSSGTPLTVPARWLSRVSLRSAFQEHFSGVPVVESDSLVVFQLSAPVTITGTATVAIRLMADIATDSPLGLITPRLGPINHIDARDGNMNNPVPVIQTTASTGPDLTVLGPAVSLTVSGTGAMPAQVSRGTRDLTALNLTLTNPGEPGTSFAAGDTIVLAFFNAARQPLDPAPYLDRLRILRGTDVMGLMIDPAAANGEIALSIAGGQLAPGQSADLQVNLDFKADSPVGTMEIVLGINGIRAIDSITGAPLLTLPAPGTSLPISSGVADLVVPADELMVNAASLMPPLLAPTGEAVAVFDLEFTNPAGAGSGGIELNALTLVQDPNKASGPDLGRLLAAAQLRLGDGIVASTTDLAASATSVTLVPGALLNVAAGETVKLVVEVILKDDAPTASLQLVLREDGITAGPPGGVGLEVRILPVSGEVFPFATAFGHVGAASLAESYANFPNPFAAGREPTNFAFSLLQDARVDLRIVTPHGELVAIILQDEARAAGFYQSDVWQGLNGNGTTVRNGVYLAELTVQYSDGSRERILRKVAVVR